MFKRLTLVGAVAMVALQFVGLSAASASPKEAPVATTKIIGSVHIDPANPGIAYVTAKYSCPSEGAHLWVSVKQVASGTKDPALTQEGSSAIVSAWLKRYPALGAESPATARRTPAPSAWTPA